MSAIKENWFCIYDYKIGLLPWTCGITEELAWITFYKNFRTNNNKLITKKQAESYGYKVIEIEVIYEV